MESTLVLIKPDGVKRGLCGEIISRFERRGLRIAALKLLKMTEQQASIHYHEHLKKPFYPELLKFMISGPLIAMLLQGPNATNIVRDMMGPTNPAEANPGTIRGDYALSVTQNIVHGSDSLESAKREIAIFFSEHEII